MNFFLGPKRFFTGFSMALTTRWEFTQHHFEFDKQIINGHLQKIATNDYLLIDKDGHKYYLNKEPSFACEEKSKLLATLYTVHETSHEVSTRYLFSNECNVFIGEKSMKAMINDGNLVLTTPKTSDFQERDQITRKYQDLIALQLKLKDRIKHAKLDVRLSTIKQLENLFIEQENLKNEIFSLKYKSFIITSYESKFIVPPNETVMIGYCRVLFVPETSPRIITETKFNIIIETRTLSNNP